MHVFLFLSLCLMPHKTITCQSAYIGLQFLVCGFPPSDPPHTSNLIHKQLHAKRCPCGLQSLVCVCGFPPSDPPHTQAIPWRTCKSPPACMGPVLLHKAPPAPPQAKQLHVKLRIYGLQSLVCVVSLPLTHHTQAIPCQGAYIWA